MLESEKIQPDSDIGKEGHVGGGHGGGALDGISPGKAISTFQTRMSLSNWLQL